MEELSRDQDMETVVAAGFKTCKGHMSYPVAATALKVADGLWKRVGRWSAPILTCRGTALTYTSFLQRILFFYSIKSEDKTAKATEGGLQEHPGDQNGPGVTSLYPSLDGKTTVCPPCYTMQFLFN